MKRYISLILIIFWINAEAQNLKQTKPNFIVILTDDQRMDALGANGNDIIITPAIDKLAQNAAIFTNANAVFSLCSPSRAAILTGRYGSANGVLELGSDLNKGEKSVAQYLKENGYTTGFSGKWHLGQKPKMLGFDFSVYFESNGAYYNRLIQDEEKEVRPAQHCDEYCVDRSIEFLESVAENEQPFFLFHCTQLPHMNGNLIWNAKLETLNKYNQNDMPVPITRGEDLSQKPAYLKEVRNFTKSKDYGYPDSQAIQKHVKEYYAVITEMDDALSRLIKTVEDKELMENTYIIFVSDNGWMLGEHGFTSKVLPYKPSTQIPFFILGEGIEKSSKNQIVLNIDIAPTLLDLAGISIPENMHGKSIVPLLGDENPNWREAFVYEGLGSYGGAKPNLTVFDGQYRYIVTYQDNQLNKVYFLELYDNILDPNEQDNLALQKGYTQIIERLNSFIESHRAKILKEN
ncbi:sulfatase-like hydrolase/transferase [Chondrinema litorale]|uniref:sulfatase-like hydrolase/transferase n=1 Tax=Chondrinema litorale TaxID=2994555 RepID=UPI0025430487|nr:sulfatase-like hydrolase/transferase [Chondrinema litorale]UZR96653.1 sulfatase-like hydrolase/transferase [Chondrinema litorale]